MYLIDEIKNCIKKNQDWLDWTKLTKTTDPQTACELFFDTIKDIVKKSTDIKEIKTHNKKIKP